jgi:hypothetical protein
MGARRDTVRRQEEAPQVAGVLRSCRAQAFWTAAGNLETAGHQLGQVDVWLTRQGVRTASARVERRGGKWVCTIVMDQADRARLLVRAPQASECWRRDPWANAACIDVVIQCDRCLPRHHNRT